MQMTGISDSQIARIQFHGRLAALWNMAWLGDMLAARCDGNRGGWHS